MFGYEWFVLVVDEWIDWLVDGCFSFGMWVG